MEDIKTIFKHVLIGTFSACLVSILSFYSLCEDVKTQVFLKDDSRRRAFLRYLKRYVLSGVYLAVLGYFWGLPMILSAAVGLLNIKLNIYLLPIFKKLKNYSRKEE